MPCWRSGRRRPPPRPWERGRAHNLCGRKPLVLDPQTMMSMGVESFTEERTGSARAVGIYVLVVDVTCVKSLWSSYGVVSPDSPSRGCQGEWMVLRGVLSPDSWRNAASR